MNPNIAPLLDPARKRRREQREFLLEVLLAVLRIVVIALLVWGCWELLTTVLRDGPPPASTWSTYLMIATLLLLNAKSDRDDPWNRWVRLLMMTMCAGILSLVLWSLFSGKSEHQVSSAAPSSGNSESVNAVTPLPKVMEQNQFEFQHQDGGGYRDPKLELWLR